MDLFDEVCHWVFDSEASEAKSSPGSSLCLVVMSQDANSQLLTRAMPTCLLPLSPPW